MKWISAPPLGTPLDWAHPLNKGLVGFWPMNEGMGNKAYDISGNGNHGTLTNMAFPPTGASGWNPGRKGRVLQFDGVDDYVNAGNGANLNITNAITIEMWVKRGNTGTVGSLIMKGDETGNINYKLTFLTTNVLELYAGGGTVTTNTFFTDTTAFYHIVVTVLGTTYTFYVNGVQDKTGSLVGALYTNTRPLQIGRSWGAGGEGTQYVNGAIGNVRIYNRRLFPGESRNLYLEGYGMFL